MGIYGRGEPGTSERWLFAACVVLVAALAVGWIGRTPVGAQPLTFGMHVHDPGQMLPLHVRVAEFTGADAITIQFHWREVEPVPGRFVWSAQAAAIDAARERDVRVVGVLAYPADIPLAVDYVSRAGWPSGHVDDWSFFVSNVVSRFGKHVDSWVIDSGAERGGSLFGAAEAETHAAFVRLTVAAVRRMNPQALLFAAVPGVDVGWLQVFGHHGGISAVDGLALDVNRWPTAPAGLSVVVEDVRAVARRYDATPLLWAWQFGYPTHQGVSVSEPMRRGVTEDELAAWLVQSHVILAEAGVPTTYYYELVDRGPNEADALHNFGLYDWAGREKLAARSYSVMANMLRGLHYARAGDVIERPVLPSAEKPHSDEQVAEAASAVSYSAELQSEADPGVSSELHSEVDPGASSSGSQSEADPGASSELHSAEVIGKAAAAVAADRIVASLAESFAGLQAEADPGDSSHDGSAFVYGEPQLEPRGHSRKDAHSEPAAHSEQDGQVEDEHVESQERSGDGERADEVAAPVYHFVFDYNLFEEQTKDEAFAVTAHVFTGQRSTVIVVWAERAGVDGGCRYGCGHVDILRWLDGAPVRAFDMVGEPLSEQAALPMNEVPLYIELPMELVHE